MRKGVGLSSDVWPSRKALKRLLQYIYLLLHLLYHKCKPLIMKYLRLITWEKNVRR